MTNLKTYLEPLRTYALNAPASDPPDILPWDRDDAWSMDGAARIALGLLLEGQSGERLHKVARYLLAFCIEGYGPRIYPDAFLLNGTALALCGYLAEGEHPEAELWRVTGAARLASDAHQRRAAVEDELLARCIMAVCEVADALEAPILADLITLRERMWGRLRDHGRAERLHVPLDDYVKHMTDPVEPEELGELMRGRDWQSEIYVPNPFEKVDRQDADQTCENLFTLRAHMLVRHQFGSEIDWNLRLFDDKESTVSLNHHRFITNLALAYAETGDEKYAQNAARLLWSWYDLNPVPNHRQPVGAWRTLEVGNRQANALRVTLALLEKTDAFDERTHAMLALSRLEHIRYALAFCGGPNNWYQVEASGLAVAALLSPELKFADAYLRIAMRRLRWLNSFAYYDDGFQFELSHGYHRFPTTTMFSVIEAARGRGVELPEDFTALVEKAHEMYLYAVQPDYIMPTFNDCGPNFTDPAEMLWPASVVFGREDFRWGATHGEQGAQPDHASHAWDSAGLYVMRDKWGEDAQYLHFDGAPWGASHQHEDKLNFVIYAGGRQLIGDPNIYSYSWTEITRYFKSSRAHNVVMIDGMGQARRYRVESRLSTEGRNEWVSGESFDFVSSEYVEGYARAPIDPQEVIDVDMRFSHRRAIFYVKGEYWILADFITGEDDGAHKLEQIFHLAPIYRPDSPEPFSPGEVHLSPEVILSDNADVSNIAILPVDGEGLNVRAQKGETSPAIGWWGMLGEYPAWDVTVEVEKTLPARLDALLYPLPVDDNAYPTVERLRADAGVTAFRITGKNLDDTFILCEEGAGEITLGDIQFEGRALLLRRKPDLIAMSVDAITLTVKGEPVKTA